MDEEFLHTADLTEEERKEIASQADNDKDAVQAVADALLAKIIADRDKEKEN